MINLLDVPAEIVALLCQDRWQIEVFFRKRRRPMDKLGGGECTLGICECQEVWNPGPHRISGRRRSANSRQIVAGRQQVNGGGETVQRFVDLLSLAEDSEVVGQHGLSLGQLPFAASDRLQ